MKISLLVVLVVALCTDFAFSLKCFTCKDATSNIQCFSMTTCADHEKFCLTSYSTTGYGKDLKHVINKKCSTYCPEVNLNIGIASIATSCCDSHLCNISGASSVKTSYTMIALAVLASLTCIFRMGF
ncbi:lymphocyte antigen 6E-like [Pogoniulus pusillus]|uniref:lymphocyte antigen 6E-like n=1 Tax=Pogoniulus pusillus TaxID=488313 RepID=UPI0030B98A9B